MFSANQCKCNNQFLGIYLFAVFTLPLTTFLRDFIEYLSFIKNSVWSQIANVTCTQIKRQKTGKSRICDHLPFEEMCPKIQVEILLDDVGKSIVVK